MAGWFRTLFHRDNAPLPPLPPLLPMLTEAQRVNAEEHRQIIDQQVRILRAIEEIESNVAAYRAEVVMNARSMGVPLDEK